MKCVSVRRSLGFYLDSELSPEVSLAIADHLESCGGCRRRSVGEARIEAGLRDSLAALDSPHVAAMDRAVAGALGSIGVSPALAVAVIVLAAIGGALAPLWLHRSSLLDELGPRARLTASAPMPATAHTDHPFPEMLETMKPTTVLGAALCVSVASAASTAALLDRGAPAALSALPGALPAEVTTQLAELTRQQDELRATIASLRAELAERPRPGTQRSAVLDEAAIERAVVRVLEERGALTASPDETASTPDVPPPESFAALVRGLFDPNLDDAERAEIWRELRELGLLDEAVAAFESRADAAPYDPTARTELAGAYFQKMLTESGPEAGRWGAKAADSLLEALELDDNLWEARFALAQHYSHAGLRGDSVSHLETLIAQDPGRVPEPAHAQAYLLLGNLHMDMGRRDEALGAWNAGLVRFPGDAGLLSRVSLFD